jgi:hypothetical protein
MAVSSILLIVVSLLTPVTMSGSTPSSRSMAEYLHAELPFGCLPGNRGRGKRPPESRTKDNGYRAHGRKSCRFIALGCGWRLVVGSVDLYHSNCSCHVMASNYSPSFAHGHAGRWQRHFHLTGSLRSLGDPLGAQGECGVRFDPRGIDVANSKNQRGEKQVVASLSPLVSGGRCPWGTSGHSDGTKGGELAPSTSLQHLQLFQFSFPALYRRGKLN